MSNEGKKIRVNYIGTFDDGTVFDSSVERGEPLEFTCMAGMMIPGFDAAVNEMAVGETKKVHIPAADAYGERDEQDVHLVIIPPVFAFIRRGLRLDFVFMNGVFRIVQQIPLSCHVISSSLL